MIHTRDTRTRRAFFIQVFILLTTYLVVSCLFGAFLSCTRSCGPLTLPSRVGAALSVPGIILATPYFYSVTTFAQVVGPTPLDTLIKSGLRNSVDLAKDPHLNVPSQRPSNLSYLIGFIFELLVIITISYFITIISKKLPNQFHNK